MYAIINVVVEVVSPVDALVGAIVDRDGVAYVYVFLVGSVVVVLCLGNSESNIMRNTAMLMFILNRMRISFRKNKLL